MFKLIKELLKIKSTNGVTIENQEMIVKEFPSFDFSYFSNHTMIDVVMVPKSSDNDKIVLHIPQDMMDSIELKMGDHFHIQYKHNFEIINIVNTNINQRQNPRIEIPSNDLMSITNNSMGFLKVKKGITIQEKISNKGSGNVSVEDFSGNEISNDSMGKITVKNIETNILKLSSNGSGNLEIVDGSIEFLKSDTNSMGNVKINAQIVSAQIKSNGSGNTNISSVSDDVSIKLQSMGSVSVMGSVIEKAIVSSSGSGKVSINNIDTQMIDINLTSMGNVEVTRSATEAEIKSSGSGNIKGNFASAMVNVNMSSMGNVHIEPSKVLIAKIKGMGNLNLLGNHVLESVEIQLSSMGRLKSGDVSTHSLTVNGKSEQCDMHVVSNSKKNRI